MIDKRITYQTTTSDGYRYLESTVANSLNPKFPEDDSYDWELINTCCCPNLEVNTSALLIWTWKGTKEVPVNEMIGKK